MRRFGVVGLVFCLASAGGLGGECPSSKIHKISSAGELDASQGALISDGGGWIRGKGEVKATETAQRAVDRFVELVLRQMERQGRKKWEVPLVLDTSSLKESDNLDSAFFLSSYRDALKVALERATKGGKFGGYELSLRPVYATSEYPEKEIRAALGENAVTGLEQAAHLIAESPAVLIPGGWIHRMDHLVQELDRGAKPNAVQTALRKGAIVLTSSASTSVSGDRNNHAIVYEVLSGKHPEKAPTFRERNESLKRNPKGLGLWKASVLSHFADEPENRDALKRQEAPLAMGIPVGAFVVVQGSRVKVEGEFPVTAFVEGCGVKLAPGEVFELDALAAPPVSGGPAPEKPSGSQGH